MKGINPEIPFKHIPLEDQKAIEAGKMDEADATVFTLKALSYGDQMKLEDGGAKYTHKGGGKGDDGASVEMEVLSGTTADAILMGGIVSIENFEYPDPEGVGGFSQVVWPVAGTVNPANNKVFSAKGDSLNRARRRVLGYMPGTLRTEIANVIGKGSSITEEDASD